MKITIDGKNIEFSENDANIVDVAARAKIGIPAPCYRSGRINGCCNACVIEIDGEKRFACATKPETGMNIIVNREDLIQIRKEKLLEYQNAVNQKGSGCKCDCSESSDCC